MTLAVPTHSWRQDVAPRFRWAPSRHRAVLVRRPSCLGHRYVRRCSTVLARAVNVHSLRAHVGSRYARYLLRCYLAPTHHAPVYPL